MFRTNKELSSIDPGKAGNLPDFCRADVLLRMLIMIEMGSIVMVLIAVHGFEQMVMQLALSSLFFLTLGVLTAAGLCPIRRFMRERPPLWVQSLALLWLGLVIVSASYAVTQFPPFLLQEFFNEHWKPHYFILRNLAVGLIIGAIVLRYFDINAEAMKQASSEARARLESLQARIRPHFLFNSLNSIASLTHSDPDLAEQAIENLAELIRASLSPHTLVAASDELALTQHYLALQKIRMQERLQVDWQLEALPQNQLLPHLLLQPLFENAIQHGIENLPEGGLISSRLWLEKRHIHIKISNPKASKPGPHQGHGMALRNIEERLKLLYADQASMEIQQNETQFEVNLRLPLEQSA